MSKILEKIYNSQYNSKKITFFKKVRERKNLYLSIKLSQLAYTLFAIVFVVAFALWWFQPAHVAKNFIGTKSVIDILLFVLVSYVIWQPITMELLTWIISLHIKDKRRQKPFPGMKVAFITTIVPSSEPLELLYKCLPAMVNVDYPHDTWLLDEGNDPEVKKICKKYGVLHFSRKDREEFKSYSGKFTKTKGGNHNSWYEAHGNSYDFVAQIDTDFVPKKTFLTKTLGYFRDPKIAFVGTPQVYGNTDSSIIARGAAEQLNTFYGSVLRGLSSIKMTLLIGANHIIRVAALKSVNHYSAHITEDLITGMKLHAKGWKSVYLSEPLAIGEGPATWESYFNQQMRWAYGCIDILFKHSPKLLWRMKARRALYYFFLQQHYFTGFAMALSVVLLCLYFFAGLRAADVDIYRFFGFYSATLLVCWLMSVYLQRFDVYKKGEGELLAAGKLINIAVWPVWFLAFASIITGKRLNYKVTPKGENDTHAKKSLSIFIPHLIIGSIVLAGVLSSFFTRRQNIGMLFWAFSSIIFMFSIPFLEEISAFFSKSKVLIVKLLRKIYARIKILDQKSDIVLFPSLKNKNLARGVLKINSKKGIIADSIFLASVVVFSFAFYIGKIGFYSDDWSFMGNFKLSHNQSLFGLFMTATTPNTMMRPVQNFYGALLFWLFHTNKFGYQVVNIFLFIMIALLLYAVLRQLKLPRLIALAIPLIYILLPNYSTDRFWFAVHQANLSVVFYLASLLAALKATSTNSTKRGLWKMLCIAGLALSILSYEIVVPLFLLNILILWNPFGKIRPKSRFNISSNSVFIAVILISLLYALLFKAITTVRLTGGMNFAYLNEITTSAFRVNYIDWGINLPYIWGEILARPSTSIKLLAASFVVYIVVFIYIYFIAGRSTFKKLNPSWMRNLTFISFGIFMLGYVIFFTNNQVGFSPTGVENRVAIAASIGVAITFVGFLGWLSKTFLPQKFAKIFFCIGIATICAGSFLTINVIATYWASANQKSQNVLAAIHKKFPEVGKKSTIILDGVCPYVGPAPVFEAEWDLKGALQAYYMDPTLKADVITPRLKVGKKGLKTTIYTFTTTYPYKNLYIYNYKDNSVHQISSEDDARLYFASFNKDLNNNCPNAEAGNGVTIFSELF